MNPANSLQAVIWLNSLTTLLCYKFNDKWEYLPYNYFQESITENNCTGGIFL